VKSISKIFITVVDMYRFSHRREVFKNKILLRVAVWIQCTSTLNYNRLSASSSLVNGQFAPQSSVARCDINRVLCWNVAIGLYRPRANHAGRSLFQSTMLRLKRRPTYNSYHLYHFHGMQLGLQLPICVCKCSMGSTRIFEVGWQRGGKAEGMGGENWCYRTFNWRN